MKESKSNSPLEGMKIFHPIRKPEPLLRGSGKKRLDSEPNQLPNKGKNQLPNKGKTEKNVFPLEKKNPTKMDTSEKEKGDAKGKKDPNRPEKEGKRKALKPWRKTPS